MFKKADGYHAVALGAAFSAHPPAKTPVQFQEAIAQGQLFWAEDCDPLNLWPLLSLQLGSQAEIHVAASPDVELKDLQVGTRRCLVISKEALASEFGRAEVFLKDLQVQRKVWTSARDDFLRKSLHTSKQLVSFLRRARQHDRAWALACEVAEVLPGFQDQCARSLEKPRLLLHICCGPDAGGVIQQLKNEFDLTCFWYDPNIQPEEEHGKRLDAFLKVARLEKVPAIIGEYDVDRFLENIKGLEHTPEQGAKCSNCYDMRLERAAQEAARGDFDLYATTLAISPHKVQKKLIAFGELNEKRYGIPYFHRNFVKHEGFNNSVEYSRQHDIYRQDYCGCIFSLHEGGPEARRKAFEMGVG